MASPRATSLSAALVALALLAGACGGDDDAATDTTETTAEVDEAAESPDGESGVDEADDDGAGDPSDLTADDLLEAVERTKASDSASVQLALAFDGGPAIGSQELGLGGDVAFDGSRGDIFVRASDGDGEIRLLFDDQQAWVGGDRPEVRDALPDGAEWAAVSSEALFASEAFSNPGDLAMLYLVGGATDVREDGDVIRFDIDLDAAVASAPEELQDEVAETISLTGDAPPEVTGEVRLDDDGRITDLSVLGIQRATEEEIEALGLEEGAEIRLTLEVAISDFDEPVEVEAPPASTTVPIEEAPAIAQLIGVTPAG